MECQRCHFQNMPGQDRCLKCGSVLLAGRATGGVHPPRMARWKRPFRAVAKWLRRKRVSDIVHLGLSEEKTNIALVLLTGTVLSIVPGLGHLLYRRFREIILYVLAWAALMAGGIWFFGTSTGLFLLGLAAGVHALIAFNHTLAKMVDTAAERVSGFIFLLMATVLLYASVRRTVFADLEWGFTNMTIPWHNVSPGDCILTRRLTSEHTLTRGCLATTQLSRLNRSERLVPSARMVVQVVALPGDKIEIFEARYRLNGKALDPNQFPVPNWLRNVELSTTIPQGSYFVSSEYVVIRAERRLTAQDALGVSVVPADRLKAKGIVRWLPTRKRGRLREVE